MLNPGRAGGRADELSLAARFYAFRLTVASLLLVSAPGLWVVWSVLRRVDATVWGFRPSDIEVAGCVAAGTIFLLVASYTVLTRRAGGHWWTSLGVGLGQLPLALFSTYMPGVALLGWSWAAVLVYLGLRQRTFRGRRADVLDEDPPRAVAAPAVFASALAALVMAGWAVGASLTQASEGRAVTTLLLLAASGVATAAEWRLWRRGSLGLGLTRGLSIVTAIGALGALPFDGEVFELATLLLVARVAVALVGAARDHELRAGIIEFLFARPALLLVTTFAALSGIGGIVLMFPACSSGEPLSPLDALFTAVSASCVTGLIVVDTATALSGFGQVVVLILIQVGALGIMTLSYLALIIVAGGLGGRSSTAFHELVGTHSGVSVSRLLRVIAGATFLLELCGAILLLPTFLATEETVGGAVWKSVFHSVSAFCNAGFALQSDSLVSLARHPFALHVIALLIVLGGLGFGVIMGVWELWRRRIRRLALTDRLVLRSNAWLLALAFGGWILLEWNGALSERGFFDRLHHAWFHAVTLRTAGFNSVDLNHTGPATTFVSLVFMFVGGGPGGTAGGIKVTTAAILMCAVVSVVRGREDAEVMGRRLPRRTVYRAAAVATISAVGVLGGTLALLMTQNLPFHALLFEAFSAFGTVGLSLDVTPHLDRVGKLVVMMLMFIGRTGPMTMALLFWRPQPTRVRYIEEEVLVG